MNKYKYFLILFADLIPIHYIFFDFLFFILNFAKLVFKI